MDDTLIDERLYLAAGYEAIAALALRNEAGSESSHKIGELATWILDQFTHTGREGLFQYTRSAYPGLNGSNAEWLEALRTAKVALPALPWVEALCEALPETPMALLTNGNAIQQRNKYHQIEPPALRERFRLYCAAEYQPKPSPVGLCQILKDYGVSAHECLMIGDSAADRDCADAAGVHFLFAPRI